FEALQAFVPFIQTFVPFQDGVFKAIQALVSFQKGFIKAVPTFVGSVRALLSLRLAFRDAVQALVDFQEGFFETVQTLVRSVRALFGLGLTSRDECDGLFEVHPIEYSKGPLRPGGGGKDRLPRVDGARLDTDLEVALLFATLPVPNLDAPDGLAVRIPVRQFDLHRPGGIGEVSPYVAVGHLARFFERYVQAGGLTGHDPFHFLGDDARLERLAVVLEDARVDGDAGLGAQETRKLARVIPFDPDQHLRFFEDRLHF